MAGINRLGKGPAKPGTMRPADPNKYKTMDIFSEGTEGDKDYARMVQDIEDTQQNHSGWLFGRGAFDKGDLLYLRDEEEKRRFAEQELRESELRSFAIMRQKPETIPDELDPGPITSVGRQDNTRSQADIVKSLLRVKAGPRVKVKQENGYQAPGAKRLKTETSAPAVKLEPAEETKEEEDGLAGLLGGYGSGSEDEQPVAAADRPTSAKAPLPLPDIMIKREATVEAPVVVKQEEPPPWKEEEEEEEEQVDFSDASEDSSS